MSFYRTYRPQTIPEIDNVSVRETLASLLTKKKDSLPHAFLFSGPRGTGKTTAARVIAKIFNCMKPKKTGPCGSCEQCTSIARGTNIDVLELDAASNRGIDEIRQLRDAIHLAPSRAPFRVYIIDEVHMLTTEAFNALLKTLEEPPLHAVFVLATTDPQKIPATITSRCVHVVFSPASREELTLVLTRIAKREKITVVPDALDAIASYAEGSFRDAVKVLEQASFGRGKITVQSIRTILAVSDETQQKAFLSSLSEKEGTKALETVEAVVTGGRDVRQFLADCLHMLHDRLIRAVRESTTPAATVSDMKDVLTALSGVYPQMKSAAIPQLPLELAVIEYCGLDHPPKKSEPQIEDPKQAATPVVQGMITLDSLSDHWGDIINALKPHNHSVAGVLRSARPKDVTDGKVTIEAYYPFHLERLTDLKVRTMISDTLKRLFGERVEVKIVLGKK